MLSSIVVGISCSLASARCKGDGNVSCVDVSMAEGALTNSINALSLMTYWSPLLTVTLPMPAQSRMSTVAEKMFSGTGTGNTSASLTVDVYHTPN